MKSPKTLKYMLRETELFQKYVRPIKIKCTTSKITLSQIADLLVNIFRIQYGDTVIVHSSYKNISSCDYEPEDIIYLLKTIIGSQGNIIMPSFRRSKEFYKQIPFNVTTTKGRSGLINEIFSRTSDTIRSLHPWKSCIVWGKDAQELVKTHHLSERAFDENSPYFKAMLMKGKYVGIGVDMQYCSFLHTIEDTNTHLFNEVYDAPISQKLIDQDGFEYELMYRHISKNTMSAQSVDRVLKYLSEPYVINKKIGNIQFAYAELQNMYSSLVALAEEGISIHGNQLLVNRTQ